MVHQVSALLEVLQKLPGVEDYGLSYALDVLLPEVKANLILVTNTLVCLQDKGASYQWNMPLFSQSHLCSASVISDVFISTLPHLV